MDMKEEDYIKELFIHIEKLEKLEAKVDVYLLKSIHSILNKFDFLLYRVMHCLDNDFVPGPKFAALWQEYTDLTGIKEGDEYHD